MQNEQFTVITTADGSKTIFSHEYNEAMHTHDGAYAEAVVKHVLPSKILEKNEKILRVIDVGFGIGYNVLALLVHFLSQPKGRFLEVFSLEKNPYPLRTFDCSFDDERKKIYKIIKTLPEKQSITHNNFSLKLLVGDARALVQNLPNDHFHAIFHDPYSPAKNPELWTVDFFFQLHRVMRNEGILTTYSSAPQVRIALLEAGFVVGKAPAIGKKREGTLASKGKAIEPLSEEALACLRANKRSVPYRDATLNSSREEILERYREEIKMYQKKLRGYNLQFS